MNSKVPATVALITGANRSIGLETARALGRRGIQVVLGVRDASKAGSALAELLAENILAEVIELDVTKASDRQSAYEHLNGRYGRLDILVNNAGVWLDPVDLSKYQFNSVETVSETVLRTTFDINFFAPVLLTQTLLPLIRHATSGRIVNVSSILGSHTAHADPGSPIYGMKAFAYDASKSALNALTTHLAAALRGTRIKVNSVHPGWVKTSLGGPNATADLDEGSQSSVELALLPDEGPSGSFLHLGKPVPW